MPIDINTLELFQTFDIGKATVGVVGHGYIGKAVDSFFNGKCRVLVYDKAKLDLNTLADVVGQSELIFVAVPTPMRLDGSCHTGIVESVLSDIKSKATEISRNLEGFIVVIKSTVYPGFTEEMKEKFFPMRIMFSPEFLTEKNSIDDFKKTNRVIFGGDVRDAHVGCAFFHGVQPERVKRNELLLLQTEPLVAEMVKLFANGILATKVMFSNEVYLMCESLGIPYDDVRSLACLDERIGSSHTTVPGHDGDLGYGGHCFPKDMQSLRYVAKELSIPERIFSAVIERNEELRKRKDWLEQVGRAVIDE